MAVAAQLDSWIDFQLISLVDTGDGFLLTCQLVLVIRIEIE
jgi:hypothetical protein